MLQFRLSESLESGNLADVEVSVEPSLFPGQRETFKAHKMILALQNDVFEAMFYGPVAKGDRIVITDLHPEGVRGLLRYFYSRPLDVQTAYQAACIRTAPAKYLVPQLEERCLAFMNERMVTDEVCAFLDYVLTVGEEALATPATILIVKDSIRVLSSATFTTCTQETVRYVLKHAANVPETSVLKAVYGWGRQRLRRAERSYSIRLRRKGRRLGGEPVDFRAIMRPLLPELRFLALTSKDFVDGPNTWGIFTDAEARAILSNIAIEGSMAMPKGFCEIRTDRV
ncbi:BTB/POZ domain-containing protein 6-A-like [Dermacentor andersoni]|uniref:BTB/POZ domain-containing protein 6-A-like n=1 Tax=Dermacentor andersoni TaxID=34620 RepID=UPI0021550968|nr:BTB/POZ domain-containing protein 6-A-like [Dermacentor andersoni]